MGAGWRLFVLFVAAATTLVVVPQASAQESSLMPPSALPHSSIKLKIEDFTNPHTSGITLPFGIDYSHQTKSLVMPLDAEKLWGVGINLDIGDVNDFNAHSGLGIELQKTPGVVIQRNF